jgi:hypothetical protein
MTVLVPSDLASPGPPDDPIVSKPLFTFGPLIGSRWFRSALRWIVLTVAIIIGFHRTLVDFYQQSTNGDPGVYRILLPLIMTMCIIGVSRRPVIRVHVYDRNLDAFVALVLAVIGLSIRVLLTPKLGQTNTIWGLSDMLLGLFVLIGIIILWGLRTAWRYRLADLIILGMCPLPFLLIGAELGGTDAIYGTLSVAIATAYYLLAAGPDRSWVAAGAALLGGTALAFVLGDLHAWSTVTDLVPAILVLIALTAMIIRSGLERFGSASAPDGVTQKMPLAVGLGVVLLVGIVFGVVETGQSARLPPQAAPAMLPGCSRPPTIPGYRVLTRSTISWAPAYFGRGTTWERATYGVRPHQVIPSLAIDMVQTSRSATLNNYPPQVTYLSGLLAVQGQPTLVEGIKAQRAFTNSNLAVDPANRSWLQITMTWRNNHTRSKTVERTVISVPQTLPGINLLPPPVPPARSGVLLGSFGRLVASQPAYLITPASSVDALAHRVAGEVLTKARSSQGGCR